MLSRIKLGSEKYPALTGVRALGAIVVFLDHFPIQPDAHIIVNVMAFFYALSGFLIVRIYYEQASLTAKWLSKYFINRFARIYPVYFLLLTVAICLQHDYRPWTLLTNYTLTHALFYPSNIIIQPSWSLTVEECFYFLAPLFMTLTHRRGFWSAFALASLLFAGAMIISTRPIAFLHTPTFVLSTTFFGHFVEFFAGFYVALALMRLEKQRPIQLHGSRYTLIGLAGVMALAVLMIMIYRQVPFHALRAALLNNLLLPVPIGFLYWGLLRERTLLSRLLSSNAFGLMGRSSYSFYLLHSLVIDYISVPWVLPWMGNRALCVLLTLAFTWSISILLYLAFEEPVNLSIRRAFQSRGPSVGMQATLYR
jgi:peptidoglycan/LPS O-acetylase OafA/YrhL